MRHPEWAEGGILRSGPCNDKAPPATGEWRDGALIVLPAQGREEAAYCLIASMAMSSVTSSPT